MLISAELRLFLFKRVALRIFSIFFCHRSFFFSGGGRSLSWREGLVGLFIGGHIGDDYTTQLCGDYNEPNVSGT